MFKTTLKFVTYWNLQMRSVIHFSWVFFFCASGSTKSSTFCDLPIHGVDHGLSASALFLSSSVRVHRVQPASPLHPAVRACLVRGAWCEKTWTSGENSSFRIIIHTYIYIYILYNYNHIHIYICICIYIYTCIIIVI